LRREYISSEENSWLSREERREYITSEAQRGRRKYVSGISQLSG